MPGRTRSQRPRLLLVSALWLALLMGLLKHGTRLLPTVLARQLTVPTYSTLAQLVAMGVGLGMSFLVLDAPRRDLGLQGARGRGVLLAALLAPAAHVAICYAALGLALPTLRQELTHGAVALVRSQGGAVVSAMTEPSLVVPLLWAVVVSPVGEELLFHGALWQAVQGLLERVGSKSKSQAAENSLTAANPRRTCATWGGKKTLLLRLLSRTGFHSTEGRPRRRPLPVVCLG